MLTLKSKCNFSEKAYEIRPMGRIFDWLKFAKLSAIIISKMSENKKQKARTYARNRTRLNRRGFEKSPERDSVFLLKLILSFLAGSLWLKFAHSVALGGFILAGFPLGLVLGLLVIAKFEKRSENRKVFYAVIFVCAVLSYFLPTGIVI